MRPVSFVRLAELTVNGGTEFCWELVAAVSTQKSVHVGIHGIVGLRSSVEALHQSSSSVYSSTTVLASQFPMPRALRGSPEIKVIQKHTILTRLLGSRKPPLGEVSPQMRYFIRRERHSADVQTKLQPSFMLVRRSEGGGLVRKDRMKKDP